MRENYQDLYNLMIILGKHKKNPKEAENTLQRTVENMRDKGWIDFLGRGDYRLTDKGHKELLAQRKNITEVRDTIRSLSPEDLNRLRELAEKLATK